MSESSNTPQPFDVVLGGNNPPKNKSIKRKIEKPILKKKTVSNTVNNNSLKDQSLSSKQSTESIDVEQSEDYTQYYASNSQSVSKTSTSELEDSSNGCLVIFKWVFYGCLTFAMFTDPDPNLNFGFFDSVGSLATDAWILGLLHPSLAIRFGLSRSRWTVTAIYLPICIIAALFSSNS